VRPEPSLRPRRRSARATRGPRSRRLRVRRGAGGARGRGPVRRLRRRREASRDAAGALTVLDFSFTPAQEEYRTRLRELALAQLLPGYTQRDAGGRYPYGQVRAVLRFAAEFWRGREAERDLVVSGITAEEVARGDFNCVLPSLGPALQREFLAEASPALRDRW